ncbi:hypothetical protein NicSoilB8_00170 [Arthrobacter sp. NicSoilB8]|nr:hypothetical protein NicSoilB8_00170 [Arthrobacter sp. NicSoilB8]
MEQGSGRDRKHVQTREGYYGYVFRNSQTVLPSRTDALLPVPLRGLFPGPLWPRIALALVLAARALVLMVQFLFPWLAQFTQLTD